MYMYVYLERERKRECENEERIIEKERDKAFGRNKETKKQRKNYR